MLERLSQPATPTQRVKEIRLASTTMGPLPIAATTSCCAAMATMMGMYMADQNSMPPVTPAVSQPRALRKARAALTRRPFRMARWK